MKPDPHAPRGRGRCPAIVLLLASTLFTLSTAHAEDATGTAAGAAGDPSSTAAERLAREGGGQPDGSNCAACHGGKGEGNTASGAPRLSGLPAAYLEKQLQDFTTAARYSVVMTPIARSLTSSQRSQLARYYAGLPPPPATLRPSAEVEQRQAARGQALVKVGDNPLRVQACGNCHGPNGSGLGATAMPYLAGQQGRYLRNTLSAWRNGTRNNDPSQQMATIARRLRAEDIDALVTYLEQPGQ